MGQALLVGVDLEKGSEIVRMPDGADEYNDWRLLLSSRTLDGVSQLEAYDLVNDALGAAGFPVEDKPSLVILPMSDPTIRTLRRPSEKPRRWKACGRVGNQSAIVGWKRPTFTESPNQEINL